MDSCDSVCVVYLWATVLWPAATVAIYLLWKGSDISNKLIFSVSSLIGGYFLVVALPALSIFILPADYVPSSSTQIFILLYIVVAPVMITNYLMRTNK